MDLRPFSRIARKSPRTFPAACAVRMDHDSDGRIVAFEATDLDLYLRIALPDTRIAGSFLCPTTKELSGAAGIDIGTARIVVGEHGSRLVTPGQTVSAGDVSEYPVTALHDDGDAIKLEAADLSRLHREACYCAPSDDNRYGLNGVHLEAADGRLRAVCTDGSRLAWSDSDCDGRPRPVKHMLHDPRVLDLAGSLCAGKVTLSWSVASRTVAVRGMTSDGWTVAILSRLIDGEFPDYRAVMPAPDGIGVEIKARTADLIGALAIAAPYAQDQEHTVGVKLDGRRIGFYARAVDVGEASAWIEARCEWDCGHGKKRIEIFADIGFNLVFLMESLKAWPDDEISIRMRGPLSPAVAMSADGQRTMVVTPIRMDCEVKPAADAQVYHAPVKGQRKPAARKAVKAAPVATAEPAALATPAPCPDCADLRARLATVSSSYERDTNHLRKRAEEAEDRCNASWRDLADAQERIATLEGIARLAERDSTADRECSHKLTSALEEARERIGWLERDLSAERSKVARLEAQRAADRASLDEARSLLEATPAPVNPEPGPMILECEPEPTVCMPAPVQRARFVIAGGNLRAMLGESVAAYRPGPVPAPTLALAAPIARMSPDAASAAYKEARRALATGDASACAAALANLPTWPSRKGDALRAELLTSAGLALAV